MNLDIASIQKAYKRWSGIYNFYFGWVFHPGRQLAVQLVAAKPESRILEVGVGTGLSLPLYPKNVTVVGIDISPDMLKKARQLKEEYHLENVETLEVMNAEEMTFPDNSFDSVVAMYVATVVPSPKRFVAEMKRVCKPGGRLIILNHFYRPETNAGKLSRILAPMSKQIGFRPDLALSDFLEETGLEVDHKISVNIFEMWTILVAENRR